MTDHTWHVPEAHAGQRLDQCVLAQLQFQYSRARIQRWLADGFVQLNGTVTHAHRRVKCGDTITVQLGAAQAKEPIRTLRPEPMPLPIIFEDADLLVVDKPAGLVTHPAPGHWTGTLVNAVLWHLQQQLPDVEHPPLHATMRPGIVHRLDKETSGLLIVAKTEDAHFALAKQLKARTIHRRYLTCVHGIVDCDEGTVNVPVGRHTTDRKKMVVHDDEALGRPAVTRYRVRQRVERPDPALQVGPYTVLECWLETGRTHQVRVHMTHLGHPVIGDPTYGRRGRSNAPRHLLHARELTFQHPRTGEAMTLTAPIPADMAPYVENRTGSIF